MCIYIYTYICPEGSTNVDDIIIVGNHCIKQWGYPPLAVIGNSIISHNPYMCSSIIYHYIYFTPILLHAGVQRLLGVGAGGAHVAPDTHTYLSLYTYTYIYIYIYTHIIIIIIIIICIHTYTCLSPDLYLSLYII